jgi:DNA-binding NarL/FixJ family response regulator
MKKRHRILIADDHEGWRAAVVSLVATECEPVGLFESGEGLVEAAVRLRPDVVLLDISLGSSSGMNLLPAIRASLPDTAIIMLTSHDEQLFRDEAYRRGADGYVLKRRSISDLLPAIRRGRVQATADHLCQA